MSASARRFLLLPKTRITTLALLLLSLAACAAPTPPPTQPAQFTPTVQATLIPPTPTLTPAPLVQAHENPLTGLPVEDARLLDLPAALVSISHFPAVARPQAGLSFAAWVFEIYITEGATRFLPVFYGGFPEAQAPLVGDCAVRAEPFVQSDNILSGRVWLDANGNNQRDAWERGMGGVCVYLFRADGTFLAQTASDSNGYYAFNLEAGEYVLVFQAPPQAKFVQENVGDEETNSDANPLNGQTEALQISASHRNVDAGLILEPEPDSALELPPAKVGPVRSGRLIYADIAAFFRDSCLIYAFASPEVLELLPRCYFVQHDLDGGGYMLSVETLKELARESQQGDVDYSAMRFADDAPSDGNPALRLDVYFAYLNQAAWIYDAASQSYWRYVDDADENRAGILHPEVDRLTRRQLQFENVVVLFAQHDVVSPTNLDIHLEADLEGRALLLRDGFIYEALWQTQADKPLRLLDTFGNELMPLKRGRTWFVVVTPETVVEEKSNGVWNLRFHQPAGAK